MELKNAVAVVTGANRGLGRHLAAQLVERGAKVYAAARRPETVDLPGATPLRLDVTDAESVGRPPARLRRDAAGQQRRHLHRHAADRGRPGRGPSGDGDQLLRPPRRDAGFRPGHRGQRRRRCPQRAVGPVVAAPGRPRRLRAAKAAAWALTNAVREELAPRGIPVSALHVGYMDTDMAADVPADQKVDPAEVAAQALDGVETGLPEILADEVTRHVKQSVAASPNVA